jgi:hypothetical protein
MEKTRFTFTADKQFRDNIIYQDLEGNHFQREYLVLGKADNHAHAIELGEKASFPLVADPHEALPLFSYDHCDPAVHPELREALKYDGYRLWTAKVDVDPSSSDLAWYVGLNYGDVRINDRHGSGLAVGCRRVPPSQ